MSFWRRLRDVAEAGFRDGNVSIFLTLALCLAIPVGGVGIVLAMALCMLAASRLRLIPEAASLYISKWLRSDAFLINCLILAVTLIEAALAYYHGDGGGELETQMKQYLAALAILLTIRRHPVEIVIWGAAIGCVLAGIYAFYELIWLGMGRADGPTNAIRFGMIAALFSIFSWIGMLYGRFLPRQQVFMGIASAAGMFAVYASGSRGAVLAVPFMLLLLTLRIWRRSRSAAIAMGLLFVLFSIGLGVWQVTTVRTNLSNLSAALHQIFSGRPIEETSARNRVVMLQLAGELFAEHPWIGVGSTGWQAAVEETMRAKPPKVKLDEAFNQPHNQYANDFAKGGIVRGLFGIAMLLVPLYCFLKRHPFQFRQSSLAPLLGVVTCVAFVIFGLTESVMELSLTASIYAVLIFYLIAASEGSPLATLQQRRVEGLQAHDSA